MPSQRDDGGASEMVWQHFQKIWVDLGFEMRSDACYLAFERLLDAYTQPERHYHNLHHIAYGYHQLRYVPGLVDNIAGTLPLIELAWAYHDVYYDPSAPKEVNERTSATFAAQEILAAGGDQRLVSDVTNLILVTVHDPTDPPTTQAGRVIADIDLLTFADPWDIFRENGRRVREEYRRVAPDDTVFWSKRAEILQRFLEHRIYHTTVCHTHFEERARDNLQRAIREIASEH